MSATARSMPAAAGHSLPALGPGDVVAVRLPQGPGWAPLVEALWESEAALLPLDHRLPMAETSSLLSLARPTLLLDGEGWSRPPGGVPADPGVALIISTSGAAGEPSLVELDRRAVEWAVLASARALGAGQGDGWLACLPLSHIGGLLVVLRSMLLATPLILQERFDPLCVMAASDQAAYTSLVPTMLSRLLDIGADLRRFRGILVGGSALHPSLLPAIREGAVPAVLTYGQTQSCGGVVYDGVPLEEVEVRIAESGEVELGGPTLMRGYRLDPLRTAEAFTPEGRLRTGDAGRMDAEGRLRIEGRLDDLLLTGGEKVWPAEVEAVLLDHPAVAEVAVTGRADREWGMRVVAHVVPADASAPPSLEQLRDLVSGRTARYKAPAELVLVESLPRTPLGKVRRAGLTGSAGGQPSGGLSPPGCGGQRRPATPSS